MSIVDDKFEKATKLYTFARNEADFEGDEQDTPTPKVYLLNKSSYRNAWEGYNRSLAQMPPIMRIGVTSSSFHTYMKYMYETF